jgi:hypothetical protein
MFVVSLLSGRRDLSRERVFFMDVRGCFPQPSVRLCWGIVMLVLSLEVSFSLKKARNTAQLAEKPTTADTAAHA